MAKKSARAPERSEGRYSHIPHVVQDSPAFIGASHKAKALLFEVMRQHNGKNNGHLHLTMSWLKKRGWRSADQVSEATEELLDRQLIVQTRQGGLNWGPNLFALSWHHITNYVGLDIQSKDYRPGRWVLCSLPPTQKRKPPQRKRDDASSDRRDSAAPTSGTEALITVPVTGPTTGGLGKPAVPTSGNNETLPFPRLKTGGRVVGAKGRSGKAMAA